jgi:hypothetical protein
MPVACEDDWQVTPVEGRDVFVERRDDGIGVGDGQTAAGEKVPLHVDDQERITAREAKLVAAPPAVSRVIAPRPATHG